MKTAILSDIHGNLAAMQSVLADIESIGVDRIVCLGDVVGYGPEPLACLDRVMQFDACILGNHDSSSLFDCEGFNSAAEGAIFWTRRQIEMPPDGPEHGRRRMEFLCNLPRFLWMGSDGELSDAQDDSDDGTADPDDTTDPAIEMATRRFLLVHGSPRGPTNEYVFPEDVQNVKKLDRLFDLVESVSFQGHTHVPGIFVDDRRFLRPEELTQGYSIVPGQKLMVNVGSVGQPRDGNPDSCYVVLDEHTIQYRRVSYDIESTVAKILAEPDLDDLLGYRLREGR